jgi:phosphoenolpyruvate phosphomutase
MHSKINTAEQILAFMAEWQDTCPVVVVPTMYYDTPTQVFAEAGISVVIWANHLMRSSITAMQQTAAKLYEDETLQAIESEIVPVREIFRLQNAAELKSAEKLYLPAKDLSGRMGDSEFASGERAAHIERLGAADEGLN